VPSFGFCSVHICVSHVPLVTTHKCASRPDSCTAGFVIRVDVNYLPAVFALCICLCVEIIVVAVQTILTLVVMHTPLQHTNHSKAAFKQDMSFRRVSFPFMFPFLSSFLSFPCMFPVLQHGLTLVLHSSGSSYRVCLCMWR